MDLKQTIDKLKLEDFLCNQGWSKHSIHTALSEQSMPFLNILYTIIPTTTRLLENFTLVQRTSYQESIRCIK